MDSNVQVPAPWKITQFSTGPAERMVLRRLDGLELYRRRYDVPADLEKVYEWTAEVSSAGPGMPGKTRTLRYQGAAAGEAIREADLWLPLAAEPLEETTAGRFFVVQNGEQPVARVDLYAVEAIEVDHRGDLVLRAGGGELYRFWNFRQRVKAWDVLLAELLKKWEATRRALTGDRGPMTTRTPLQSAVVMLPGAGGEA